MKAYNIGDCIRQLREEQNVNQEDLCHGLCNKSTLSRIERGCHVPSIGTVALLLQRLALLEHPRCCCCCCCRVWCVANQQQMYAEHLPGARRPCCCCCCAESEEIEVLPTPAAPLAC